MVKPFLSLLAAFFLFVTTFLAQNDFIQPGLLQAAATISPAFMLSHPIENIYLHGNLEYYPENRISIRGDTYWYLGAQQKPQLMKQFSILAFGAAYHFPKNNFDFFLGLQPALAAVQPDLLTLQNENYSLKFSPCITAVTGVTYYVYDYFNFFLNLRMVQANYHGYEPLHLDEIILSAGLGFNIHTQTKIAK